MTNATFEADLNLLIQLAMGSAFLAGAWLARRKRFGAHAGCQTAVIGQMALVAAVLLGAVGVAAVTSEKPPDSYVKNMKETNAANNELRKSVDAKDYAATAKQAAALKALFENTLNFWEQRKAEDAIVFAKAGASAASDIETAAKSKNAAGMTSATAALQASCKSCHDAHRERLPDGSSEIK